VDNAVAAAWRAILLGERAMKVIIISIEHPLQLMEEQTDSISLRASRAHLRKILEEQLASVSNIFEECHPKRKSIAAQLASDHDPPIPWQNISMPEEKRKAKGIYEALQQRPGRPDDTYTFTIEVRIPADEQLEEYFEVSILTADGAEGDVIVLLGDMHVQPVADRLRSKGHDVVVRSELVPIKKWTNP
jgi:hypothetical protein